MRSLTVNRKLGPALLSLILVSALLVTPAGRSAIREAAAQEEAACSAAQPSEENEEAPPPEGFDPALFGFDVDGLGAGDDDQTEQPVVRDPCAEPEAPAGEIDQLVDEENDGTTRGSSGQLLAPDNVDLYSTNTTQIKFSWSNRSTATNPNGSKPGNWVYYRQFGSSTYSLMKLSGTTTIAYFTVNKAGTRVEAFIKSCLDSGECSNPSSFISAPAVTTGVRRANVSYTGCPKERDWIFLTQGQSYSLRADCPTAGSRFVRWSDGACAGSTNPVCIFTYDQSNRFGVAQFQAPPPPPAAPLVIVSIGDSFGSGEGNPDRNMQGTDPARWSGHGDRPTPPNNEDHRCHRSSTAPANVAADKFKLANPGRKVIFMQFACTGASIANGIINEYNPETEPGYNALPRQLDQVRDVMRAQGLTRIDKLIISFGGNDAGFAEIIASCINPINLRGCDRDGTTASTFEKKVGDLPDLYFQLWSRIRNLGIPVDNTYLVEYADPLTKRVGSSYQVCGNYLGVGGDLTDGISPNEAQWARDVVIRKLNGEVSNAAKRFGWVLVGGVQDAYFTHGYCAGNDRWFNTQNDAQDKQGRDTSFSIWLYGRLASTGMLHPNKAGQARTGEIIYQAIK